MNAWMLQTPEGHLVAGTLTEEKDQAWMKAFPYVAGQLGEEWTARFWKRWNPAIRSAHRKGWRIVKLEIKVAE